MPLPHAITIGAVEYEVATEHNLHSSNGDLYGRIAYDQCKILVDDAYADCQRTPLIVWHEVVHGILEQAGLDETDEKIVTVLGYGIVAALKNNPYLRCNPPVESEKPISGG